MYTYELISEATSHYYYYCYYYYYYYVWQVDSSRHSVELLRKTNFDANNFIAKLWYIKFYCVKLEADV